MLGGSLMHDQLLSALDQIQEQVLFCDRKLQLLWANTAACLLAGRARDDLVGKQCFQVFHGRSQPCTDCHALRAMKRLEPVRSEQRTPDGLVWSVKAYPLLDAQGSVEGVLKISLDITDLRREAGSLEDREARYRSLMAQVLDGVCVVDVGGRRIDEANRALASLLGYSEEEMRGLSLYALLDAAPDEVDECLDRAAGAPEGWVCERRLRAKDGRSLAVEMSLSPIRTGGAGTLCVVCRDLGPRKAREQEWLRAHKLEALGMLAGGIAHDFNNALAAILGNISLAKVGTEPGSRTHERLVNAEQACFRAQAITRQLLTFSNGGEPIKTPLDAKKTLMQAVYFALSGSAVKAEVQAPADLWPILADESLVRQAIHQIVLCRKEAVGKGGKMDVRAENVVIPQDRDGLPAGRYVRFSIRDHGPGLSRERLERVFDPYFCGPGSGIGLSVAYSVVRRHGGTISVDSKEGHGTEVWFLLPAAEDRAIPAGEREDGSRGTRGTGRVLVMDDEEMVRETVGEMLRLMGFEVTLAQKGGEAVEAYRRALESGRPYDVVVLDLTVPGGMGGQETLEALRKVNPEVRAIVSSGYSNDPVMARYRDYGFDGMVAKPYKMEDLAVAIRRVMDGLQEG
jgi:PAS domain S-box-containing protein